MRRAWLDHRFRRTTLVSAGCLAFAAGVLAARRYELADGRTLWVLAPLLAVTIRRQRLLGLCILLVVCFGAGWWRGTVTASELARNTLLYGKTVTIVGEATSDAVYGTRYQLEFTMAHSRAMQPVAVPLAGSLTVRGFGEPAVYSGDVVTVTGKLYPTRGNSVAGISYAGLHVVERHPSLLTSLRRRFAAGLESTLPEPLAAFALGLLIGQRSTLPEDTADGLRRVGLTHIIAVSGYNLTILVIASRRLLTRGSKFQGMALSCGLICLFLAITGLSPPIVRASVVSGLGLAAWYYGRPLRPVVLLLTSAVITIGASPAYLWGNVSWYLSFLSFCGVLLLAPVLTRYIYGNREPKFIAATLIETVCATVCVLPYSLLIFGQASLVSLPANLLVVPFVPLAMAGSAVAGVMSMILPALAGWGALPAHLLLTYMLDTAGAFSRLPHAYLEDIDFSWPGLVLAYTSISVLYVAMHHKVSALAPISSTCTRAHANKEEPSPASEYPFIHSAECADHRRP